MIRFREHPEESAKCLVGLLLQSESADERLHLLDDLIWKTRPLSEESKLFLQLQGALQFADPVVHARFQDTMAGGPRKRSVDVAVVTVVEPELTAAKLAFDIPASQYETFYLNGIRCWQTSLFSERLGRDIDLVLTMVAEPGNVECALALEQVLSVYDAELCILVGMAAGVEEKVKLGDVVIGNLVIDYERARLEPDGSKKRPLPFPVENKMGRDLAYFQTPRTYWLELLHARLPRLHDVWHNSAPSSIAEWAPKAVLGVVLAGEKLLADGRTLDALRTELHDLVRAAEMEGAGFARVCREHAKQWVVVRGITDYADPRKNNEWQAVSALSAACVARELIEHGYYWSRI